MQLSEEHFKALLAEMIDENPIAARAVLRILRTEFTEEVSTLAVTLEARPRLLVNLGFLNENCKTEAHVKACILHEFLHVLLGHTERFKRMTPVENLALDTVVNAIIHRSMGDAYSDFFLLYYRDQEGLGKLLRRKTQEESADEMMECLGGPDRNLSPVAREHDRLWSEVYRGKLVVDDILDLAKDLAKPSSPHPGGHKGSSGRLGGGKGLIGNHDGIGDKPSEALAEALDEALQEMNGSGIWRSPHSRGVGQAACAVQLPKVDLRLERWKAETFQILREFLIPDRRAPLTEVDPFEFRLPVLTPRDRRAFLQSLWSPILPNAEWQSEKTRALGRANIYLDVSGSMHEEMPIVLALLWQLRHAIRSPFWAFSDVVKPARIEDGRLVTETTGGTSMACVLDHLERTRPPAAVVFTDGYIEQIRPARVARLANVRLCAVVTRHGSPAALHRAGIPYRQLKEVPK